MAVKCKERPELLKGQPIGMYHCPECGEMLIAGLPHPDFEALDKEIEMMDKIQKAQEDE